MKACKTILFLTLLACISLLFGCSTNENADSDPNDNQTSSDDAYIFTESSELALVLGKDVTSNDVKPIIEQYLQITGKHLTEKTADSPESPHEIIVGMAERDISDKAYRLLSRKERSDEETGYIIYSNGKSVIIAYLSDQFESDASLTSGIDYFVNNYMNDSSLVLEQGVIYETLFNTVEWHEASDRKITDLLWEQRLSQLTVKLDGNSKLAKDIIDAMKDYLSIYEHGDVTSWITNLYCPENGGFYYSNSARNNLGYLPDLESTSQALGIIGDMLSLGYDGTLEDFLGEKMVSEIIKFVKDKQDPENGFFYHPQWSKELTDSKLSRRARDLTSALNILERFDALPTYDTPTGVEGDGLLADGTPVAPASHLSSPYRISKPQAVSSVIYANDTDANVPSHLKNKEAFEVYLSTLDIKNNYYSVGNTLESQAPQIVQRDKVLAERGESYRLADICSDWLTKNQNPVTGLWNSAGLTGYLEINGLLKIGSTYSKLGKAIPNALKGAEAAVKCMTSDTEPEYIVDIFNTWYALTTVFTNVNDYGDPTDKTELTSLKDKIYSNYPEMLLASKKKVALFIKEDGSFSYNQMYSSELSQGMPVAVRNSVEGDVNSTMIATRSIPGHMWSILGLSRIPILGATDRLKFSSIMREMGYIIKNKAPELEPITFDDDTLGQQSTEIETIIASTGSIHVEKHPSLSGNILRVKSTSDGGDEVHFPTKSSFYGAPCNVLDFDMCVLDNTDEGYFAQLYLFPNMYMIGINRVGNTVRFYEESSYTAANSFSHDTGAVAKIGEWFNLRIEYYTGTAETVRIKIYFNGDCVAVTNNYFDAKANKLDGEGNVPLEYQYGRLYLMQSVGCDLLIDNVIVDQNYSIYIPETNSEKQPYRNIDPPVSEQIIHTFEDTAEGTLPNGFISASASDTASVVKENGNGYLSINSRAKKITIPLHNRDTESNSAVLEFNISVSSTSAVGSKYEISFNEFMYKNRSLLSFHLLVIEENGQKYVTFAEGSSGTTAGMFSHIKLPLGESFEFRVEFYFNESAALLYINNELLGMNGTVLGGQRRFYMGEVTIASLTESSSSSLLIDNLICERVVGDYIKASAPAINRETHLFDNISGFESAGMSVSGGKLTLESARDNAYLKIPVNHRSNIFTLGYASLYVEKTSYSSGEFDICFTDKDGNIIIELALVSSRNGIEIYEVTENGKYNTPLYIISQDAFTLSIEYSPRKESINILVNESCVAVSSLNYSKGSCSYGFDYLLIKTNGRSGFLLDNAVAETTGGLFRSYEISVVNEDNNSEIMTYESSSFLSIPKRITKSFVTSGSDLRIREGIINNLASKVLEFSTRPGGNDILTFSQTKPVSDFNAVAFETDIMISASCDNFYVDIEPMANGTRAYKLRLLAKNDGVVSVSSEEIAKIVGVEGEWFKLRMEYTKTNYDYDYDGTTDIIFRLIINGEPIAEGYKPYTGEGFDASAVTKLRFFTLVDSNGEIFFDNTVFEQFTMEYEEPEEFIPDDTDILTYENGRLPTKAQATLVTSGAKFDVISMTVGEAVSKVLQFTTSPGGNDYLNFLPTVALDGANAISFETDFMMNPTVDGNQFQIEPITSGSKRAIQLLLSATKNGNVTLSASGVPSTVIGKAGEWIHIRIDYMAPGIDYNLDGTTDILYKIYVGEGSDPVIVGYTPYRSGELYAPIDIAKIRFFALSAAHTDILFDNTSFKQLNLTADPDPNEKEPDDTEKPDTPGDSDTTPDKEYDGSIYDDSTDGSTSSESWT